MLEGGSKQSALRNHNRVFVQSKADSCLPAKNISTLSPSSSLEAHNGNMSKIQNLQQIKDEEL
eukprot:3525947-Ditylum_brightwellii.AAC.1